jgi:hypothetical protein
MNWCELNATLQNHMPLIDANYKWVWMSLLIEGIGDMLPAMTSAASVLCMRMLHCASCTHIWCLCIEFIKKQSIEFPHRFYLRILFNFLYLWIQTITSLYTFYTHHIFLNLNMPIRIKILKKILNTPKPYLHWPWKLGPVHKNFKKGSTFCL